MGDKEYIVGVDLGGTNIVSCILDSDCRILAKDRRPTMADLGVDGVIARIICAIQELLAAQEIKFSQIRDIGVSSPGLVDTHQGLIFEAVNLTGWKNIPLRDILEEKLKLPVVVGHDAAMAAWGEKHYGAGIGIDNLVCATIGTGVGMGIIIDGKLYERSTGDFGHMTIDRNGPRCSCGGYGCLERLVGGPRIAARAIERIKRGEETLMTELIEGDVSTIEAKIVFDAARSGDKVAGEIVEEIGGILAIGANNVFVLLNPELFIIGGMIAQAGDILFDAIKRAVARHEFFQDAEKKIVPAKLGEDAAVMGLAHLVKESW